MKNATFLIIFIAILLGACTPQENDTKKVFYLNSYHQGYGSSDDIQEGIEATFKGKNIDLEIYYMDTKRIENSQIPGKVDTALQRISKFDPDVIIASDDNAVKYVISPHFKDRDIPVIFCGVNWSCEQYGLPTNTITGMLEVLPVEATVDTIRKYYDGISRLAVLSENTTSEQNNKSIMSSIFMDMGLDVSYNLVNDFSAWKEQFIQLNDSSDIIFIPTNGAVKGWDNTAATAFVKEHIEVPVITCDDFMMPFAVYGLTKIAKEQGEWAAGKAVEVLNGKKISTIELTQNSKNESWYNPELASEIGFEPSKKLIEASKIVE